MTTASGVVTTDERLAGIEAVDPVQAAYLKSFLQEFEKKNFVLREDGKLNGGIYERDYFQARAIAPFNIMEAELSLSGNADSLLRFSIMTEWSWRDGFLSQIAEEVVKRRVSCILCAREDVIHQHVLAAITNVFPWSEESIPQIVDFVALLDQTVHDVSVKMSKRSEKYGKILSRKMLEHEREKSRMRGEIMDLQRRIGEEEKAKLQYMDNVRGMFQRALVKAIRKG